MAIQPQINVVPTSSSTGTTPLVQGGQIVENNAAALGGLGYIRIATPSTSSQQESKVCIYKVLSLIWYLVMSMTLKHLCLKITNI
jgi:uncharacterized membrane protein affecting hemolysin expression